MKKHPSATLLAACCMLFLSGWAGAQQRGDVIAVEQVAARTAAEVHAEIVDLVNQVLPGVPPDVVALLLPTPYDVAAFRVVYHTIDLHGQPTVASGLAVLPVGYPYPLPLVTYHHGTIAADREAPSSLGFEALIGYVVAADGYLALLPDYLGFGANTGLHPYVHADSEASAAIDMMRAVRQAAAFAGLLLNGQVFLAGYSQGAHACVATLRATQEEHPGEFNVVMTVAGSGPYNPSGVQLLFSSSNPEYASPGYLPYVLLSYQAAYGNLYGSLSEAFVPPYDTLIPQLFDGTQSMSQINSALPSLWRQMFQPAFLDAVETNPLHPVRAALRDNDLLDFAPASALTMYYGTEDEQVDYRNSVVAWFYYRFIARASGPVRAVNLGPLDHGGVAPLSLILGKFGMDLRRTVPGG